MKATACLTRLIIAQTYAARHASYQTHPLRAEYTHYNATTDAYSFLKTIAADTIPTNSMAYGTRRFNAAFTRALQ